MKDRMKKAGNTEKTELLLAFAVCGLAMYLFCTYSVTRYPRESTLLTGDVLGQYLLALRSFVRNFWSFENYRMKKTLGNLGMYVSPRVMTGQGLNPMTQMLLGVKYVIRSSGAYVQEDAGATIGQYPRTLGLGFLVNQATENLTFEDKQKLLVREYEPEAEHLEEDRYKEMLRDYSLTESQESQEEIWVENVFENCNALAQGMLGEEIDIFTRVPVEKSTIVENGVYLGQSGEDFFFLGDLREEGAKWIDFRIPEEGKDVYIVFE